MVPFGMYRLVEVSKEFDAEALRVIRAMPNWIPAETNGKIVATKVQLPIGFK